MLPRWVARALGRLSSPAAALMSWALILALRRLRSRGPAWAARVRLLTAGAHNLTHCALSFCPATQLLAGSTGGTFEPTQPERLPGTISILPKLAEMRS